MEPRSLAFVRDACAARLLRGAGETLISRVITDSRVAQAGDLFVAISGEKFDGHDFVATAAERGVAAILVEQGRLPQNLTLPGAVAVLQVENPRRALGQLAARYRNDFPLPIVVVGGSNGKTTTKELLASVLRQKFVTLWSEASFNNDIGVPLTLLRLERTHQAAVLEVGTNHPGELAPLLEMIRPTQGVITCIGREHLEFFEDLAGVAAEEGTIGERLPPDGRLFINGDGDWAEALARRTRAPVVRTGLTERNDWQARSIRVGEDGVKFQVTAPRAECSGEYRVQLLGRHQVSNALLALAAGTELGVAPEQLRRGLAECPPPKMRMQLSSAHGVHILDDTYNANADSMTAALETLRDLPCAGRRVAVLGDMAELGRHAEAAHVQAGELTASGSVDILAAVGRWAEVVTQAARNAGLREVHAFPDVATAAVAIPRMIRPGDLVLLKASRSTGLERVVSALRSSPAGIGIGGAGAGSGAGV